MKTKSAILILLVCCTTNQIIGISRNAFLAGVALGSVGATAVLGMEHYKNWIISKAVKTEHQKAIKEKIALIEPISKSKE